MKIRNLRVNLMNPEFRSLNSESVGEGQYVGDLGVISQFIPRVCRGESIRCRRLCPMTLMLFVDPTDHRARRDGSSTAYKQGKVIVFQTRLYFRNSARTLGIGPNEARFRRRHTLFGTSFVYRIGC